MEVVHLQKERNFYYDKLRKIEMLTQKHLQDLHEGTRQKNEQLMEFIAIIQNVLYAVEDGFEIPENVSFDEVPVELLPVNDNETF